MAFVIAFAVRKAYGEDPYLGQAKYRFYFVKNADKFAPYQEGCNKYLYQWGCSAAIVSE